MFPTRMKAERIKKGWTQKHIANMLGLTVTSISDIENGKAKPSYKVLCQIEDIFSMTHRELFRPLD